MTNASDIGVIYVLANQDHSLSKVGMTRTGSPQLRADDYSRAHGIHWTHVYWEARTENVAEVEAAAHRALADRRFALTPEAAEIFHTTPEIARRAAERFVVPVAGEAAPSAPRWARGSHPEGAYLELLAAAAIAELGRLVTARLRQHRYARQLIAGWSVLARRLQSFR
jgi:hypothetical protein